MKTEPSGAAKGEPPLTGASEPRVTPSHRLPSADNVAIATFIGLPVGGAWLMASNERRLGNASRARATLVLGVVSTVALFALVIGVAIALGDQPPPLGFPKVLIPVATRPR